MEYLAIGFIAACAIVFFLQIRCYSGFSRKDVA